jgi:hypothetical protein
LEIYQSVCLLFEGLIIDNNNLSSVILIF